MKLNVAVQMDPIARINIRGDSTFALLLEAQKRGHSISYYTPDKLSLRGEELVAPVQKLTVRDEEGNHFTLGEPKREALDGFDVVLLRQDPPFDLAYITSTHFLERIHPKTLVVNNPASVRNAPEKLFVMNFPQLMPPTLISRSRGDRSVAWAAPLRTMLERRSSAAGTRLTAPANSPSTRMMRLSPCFTSGRKRWITQGSRKVTENMSNSEPKFMS